MNRFRLSIMISGLFVTLLIAKSTTLTAQSVDSPFSNPRNTQIPASISGTFFHKGKIIIYPFFEYSYDHNQEYQPAQYGFGNNNDLRAPESPGATRVAGYWK